MKFYKTIRTNLKFISSDNPIDPFLGLFISLPENFIEISLKTV